MWFKIVAECKEDVLLEGVAVQHAFCSRNREFPKRIVNDTTTPTSYNEAIKT